MSGDLISREDLIAKIFPYGMPDGGNYPINARAVRDAVMGVVAVEAEPVKHARWEVVRGVLTPGGDPLLRCPRCRSRESEHLGGIECNRAHWNYCPHCGAHMDEEAKSGEVG